MSRFSRFALAATSGAGAIALVVGCGAGAGPTVGAATGTGSSAPQTETAESTPTAPASSSDESTGVRFQAGECLNDTPTWESVGCDESHIFEVTAVVKDNKYVGNLLKRGAYRTWLCNEKANDYLGNESFSTMLLGEPLPTAADPSHNDQIVCLVRQGKAADKGTVVRHSSLKGALTAHGLFKYRVCLSAKASADTVSLTSCDGPHVSEATWGFSLGTWGDPFPGARKINKTSLKKCERKSKQYLGGVSRDDIASAQNSSGEGAWKTGTRSPRALCRSRMGRSREP